MTYTITGRLYGGAETPAFEAVLREDGEVIAEIVSHGRGGCALVRWGVIDVAPERVAAAKAWLHARALEQWKIDTGAAPDEGTAAFLRSPHEAAIVVVPAMLERAKAAKKKATRR